MKSHIANQQKEKELRFEFGKNWSSFLSVLDESRINEAESSLRSMLGMEELSGKTFLDIGCGSGLFSLAARRLGARVYSFDYDEYSVACCQTLRENYFPGDDAWVVEQGSVLDAHYMRSLGCFDIVYSWGVLHHTGNMSVAMENAANKVGEKGLLYIALYNDQGVFSQLWAGIKKLYCSGVLGKALVCAVFIPLFFVCALVSGALASGNLFASFVNYKKKRGMAVYYDWLDWLGGYPFEVARIDKTVCLFLKKQYSLVNLRTTNGWGCNEFVFLRKDGADH